MERSLIRTEVAPFFAVLALLVGATLVVDGLLHALELVWVGRFLGIPGTLIVLVSFLYSLRKRKFITTGSPKNLLRLHENLTLLGALLVLVHAGVHFNAILPWLAVAAMLVTTISGLTGKLLLKRSRRQLTSRRQALSREGLSGEAIEQALFWDSVTVDLMKRWRAVHLPITAVFGVLALAHIATILLFWLWR